MNMRIFECCPQRLPTPSVAASLAAVWLVCAACPEPRAAADQENSVLVSSTKAGADKDAPDSSGEDRSEPLEPIAQISDYEPDLAEPSPASVVSEREGRRKRTEQRQPKSSEPTTDEQDAQLGAALARAVASRPKPPTSRKATVAVEELAAFAKGKRPEPAKFNGVQPGKSSRDELIQRWGEPAEVFYTDSGEVLTFDTAPFRQIDVLVADETVDVIKVELEKPLEPKRLAKQLRLDRFVPAIVRDVEGNALGQIFPERGVLFMFGEVVDGAEPGQVSHIVIQPLDADAFALRAENHLHGPYEDNIRDLKFALALDPEMAHAHWLLADIYLAIGQVDMADESASQAADLRPENDAYLLRWAETLEALGRYDEAVSRTREVIDYEDTPQVVQAQALHQLGLLASLGDAEISGKVIGFHTRAIELADQLAVSRNVKERRAAKQLLVEAHLAIARAIAQQEFDQQLDSISQWIGRASGFAEEYIENDEGSLLLRMQIADSALSALSEMKPTKDPAPWIQEAEDAADELAQEADDLDWQRRIRWQLGICYFHAVRMEHTRRESAKALKYGQKAIENLAEGAKSRQAAPDSELLVGRLYFHVGAVHAVHQNDHSKAVTWYDKALPLLTIDKPSSELAVPRRDGEAMVSMGVSYWKDGERLQGLELTQQGARLVEEAVDAGMLQQDALAVPYGNLATMHKELGNSSDAANFAKLAKSSGAAPAKTGEPDGEQRRAASPPASRSARSRMASRNDRNARTQARSNRPLMQRQQQQQQRLQQQQQPGDANVNRPRSRPRLW